MDVAVWLAQAMADAEARGLPGLTPLLEALARSTQALRDADAEFGHPASDQAAGRTEPDETTHDPAAG